MMPTDARKGWPDMPTKPDGVVTPPVQRRPTDVKPIPNDSDRAVAKALGMAPEKVAANRIKHGRK